MYRLLIQEKKFESVELKITKKEFFKCVGNFIASIVFLIISAEYLVSSAKFLANEFSIPVILIGFVVVALGTSLPELSFEVTAARENHQDMVLGDVIGSVVTNSALIVGIVGLIRPMYDLELGFINTGLFFLIFVSLVLLYFIKNDGKLTVKEGIALILSYVVFISIQYLVKMVEM
jgi:cation:H+ antiporter